MDMSSRRISALPRAPTSRSLTPSIASASMVVRSASASGCAVCAASGAATVSANAHAAQRSAVEPGSFFLGVRIFSMIHADARRDALTRWLAPHLGGVPFTLTAASEDASFRRYWRATLADGASYVAMDAPPQKEDCRPFVRVARMLREAGVHAPEIIAQDLEQGFLLLSDLGRRTYLHELNAANANRLFADAIDALLRWQLATRPGELRPYDEALLRREMNLFPEWYVERHLRKSLSSAQRNSLETIFALLAKSALAQPVVYVHRDYMPRNLMVSDPNPGVGERAHCEQGENGFK